MNLETFKLINDGKLILKTVLNSYSVGLEGGPDDGEARKETTSQLRLKTLSRSVEDPRKPQVT